MMQGTQEKSAANSQPTLSEMVYLLPSQFDSAYQQIKKDASTQISTCCCTLIFVAGDVDALCSCRILIVSTSLLSIHGLSFSSLLLFFSLLNNFVAFIKIGLCAI